MNRWDGWYDSLSTHTKESLKNQPLWRDIDLAKFAMISFAAGIIVGYIL
jgi:hypothetical protein